MESASSRRKNVRFLQIIARLFDEERGGIAKRMRRELHPFSLLAYTIYYTDSTAGRIERRVITRDRRVLLRISIVRVNGVYPINFEFADDALRKSREQLGEKLVFQISRMKKNIAIDRRIRIKRSERVPGVANRQLVPFDTRASFSLPPKFLLEKRSPPPSSYSLVYRRIITPQFCLVTLKIWNIGNIDATLDR